MGNPLNSMAVDTTDSYQQIARYIQQIGPLMESIKYQSQSEAACFKDNEEERKRKEMDTENQGLSMCHTWHLKS
jgi:hypothetical protein